MTSLDEIKSAIVDRIDTAWAEIEHEVDADKVRTYVQGLTAELLGHVYAVEAQLVNHVLGKQPVAVVSLDPTNPAPTTSGSSSESPSSAAPSTTSGSEASPSDSSTSATSMASNPQQASAEAPPAPLEPAQSAPADAVQVQPTGMAANPSADTAADVPAEPSTSEPTQ